MPTNNRNMITRGHMVKSPNAEIFRHKYSREPATRRAPWRRGQDALGRWSGQHRSSSSTCDCIRNVPHIFSMPPAVSNHAPYNFVRTVISTGISPLAVHGLDSCDDSAWSGSSLSGAKHSFGGESALLRRLQGWERHDLSTKYVSRLAHSCASSLVEQVRGGSRGGNGNARPSAGPELSVLNCLESNLLIMLPWRSHRVTPSGKDYPWAALGLFHTV